MLKDKWPDNHHHYEVIVGNVGTVYSGTSPAIAWAQWSGYVNLSQLTTGRAAGEDVTMLEDGSILKQHLGGKE